MTHSIDSTDVTASSMPLFTSYNLGPLPWKDEVLVAAVWKDFSKAREWVDEHPGCVFIDQLESLRAIRRIFEESVKQFEECLARFHVEAQGRHLFRRTRRSDLEAYEWQFQKLLYIFASTAMTLAEQARTFSGKVALPDYQNRVRAFATSPTHRFIQELRNDVVHVTLHLPKWQLTSGIDENPTSKFMLWPKQLTRLPNYHTLARQFVDEHPKGIDLGRLTAEYSSDVREFHEWLLQAANEVVGNTMDDYLRCVKRINAVSSRASWNILFQQIVIAGKRDPYIYLEEHLTEEELNEVNSLPRQSRRQIDRIIEFVDEHEACDDELRQIIYKAFGVST